MKKLASLLLCVAMLLSVMAFAGSALAESEKVVLAMPSVYDMTDTPEVQDAISATGLSRATCCSPATRWTSPPSSVRPCPCS